MALPIALHLSTAGAQSVISSGNGPQASSAPTAITVYASRFEEPLADALPQTSILTAAEILKSGASNVSEVLSRVAGLPLRLNLDGSTNAVVDIRGFGDAAANNVVVLLDGVRLSEHEQTMARTSLIPLEAIDHIEITRAGNSVLYGDGANGGTINIVTRKNVGDLTVVSGGLASYAGYRSDVYHARTLGRSELSLFARQYASDNYRKNAKGSESSAGAGWVHHLDAQTDVGLRLVLSRERNKLPGALPSIYLGSAPRNTQVPGYNWDAAVDAQSLTLFGKKTIRDVELAIDLGQRSRKNSDAYSYDAYDVFEGYHYDDWRRSYSNSSSRSETQSASPRIKIHHFLVARNTLQAGYDWLKTSKNGQAFLTFGCSNPASAVLCDNGGADAGNNTSRVLHQAKGLYARDILELSDTDKVVLGFRRETFTQSRTVDYGFGPSTLNTDGRINATELEYAKKFQPHITAWLRLSRNFRVPNADDNSNVASPPPDYSPIPLRVQTSQDVDLGMNVQTGQMGTELAYFHSQLKNEIGFDPSGCGYPCNVNYDPTQRKGLHFRQKLPLTKAFTLRSNLQYIQARFVEGGYAGKAVPGLAPLSGQLTLDYQWGPKEQISLGARWAQSRFMSGDYDNSQAKVPSYVVGDLSYVYREKNWSLVAAVN
ncbi:MAG: hypothetical protein RJA69_842, partial [Pseudomonadota bacterium]